MAVSAHYEKEKRRFLENCTQCGLCAKGCPILPYTDQKGFSFQEIQKKVFDFVKTGIPNQQAYTKAFACMECFKCTTGICPEGLNPLLLNELIKSEYIAMGLAQKIYSDPAEPESVHRSWQVFRYQNPTTTESPYPAASKRPAMFSSRDAMSTSSPKKS